MIDSLFTIESLLSLQGAAVASLIVPNVLGYLIGIKFDKYRKYISFVISFFLAFLIAVIAKVEWTGFIVAFFNGFLIFASAVGINQMGSKEKTPLATQRSYVKHMTILKKSEKPKKKFFSNWF